MSCALQVLRPSKGRDVGTEDKMSIFGEMKSLRGFLIDVVLVVGWGLVG